MEEEGTDLPTAFGDETPSATVVTENFDAVPIQIAGVGQSITTPTMIISLVSGTGEIRIRDEADRPPEMMGKKLLIGAPERTTQLVQFDLKDPCSSVKFWHFGVNDRERASVNFYAANGEALGQCKFVHTSSRSSLGSIEFSGSGIARIDIEIHDLAYVDSFSFTLLEQAAPRGHPEAEITHENVGSASPVASQREP
ncbi:hypothetical protein [Mesorhizobium retamae]|uniref:FHA domain-containing protein n=1 Tax=Mesorhizobium retamae TaxID=2912854 RepID=A0ABS9QPL5_9HYPH|nr:hypothetical protein [Mesorhizobium sp. IRAMC:0171]MCG7508626.1 hypothetical protein [Mesorhizobium sp. IRAMC:0171]